MSGDASSGLREFDTTCFFMRLYLYLSRFKYVLHTVSYVCKYNKRPQCVHHKCGHGSFETTFEVQSECKVLRDLCCKVGATHTYIGLKLHHELFENISFHNIYIQRVTLTERKGPHHERFKNSSFHNIYDMFNE